MPRIPNKYQIKIAGQSIDVIAETERDAKTIAGLIHHFDEIISSAGGGRVAVDEVAAFVSANLLAVTQSIEPFPSVNKSLEQQPANTGGRSSGG